MDAKSLRKNVYLDPRTLDLLGGCGGLSSSIRTIVDRYAELVRRERPWETLCEAERSAVRDACMTWTPEPAATIPGGIGLEIRDAEADGLGAKWGVDALALADKIDAMTAGQQIAMVDWIERQRAAL